MPPIRSRIHSRVTFVRAADPAATSNVNPPASVSIAWVPAAVRAAWLAFVITADAVSEARFMVPPLIALEPTIARSSSAVPVGPVWHDALQWTIRVDGSYIELRPACGRIELPDVDLVRSTAPLTFKGKGLHDPGGGCCG